MNSDGGLGSSNDPDAEAGAARDRDSADRFVEPTSSGATPRRSTADKSRRKTRRRKSVLDREKRELERKIISGDVTTILERVAWILNNYPDTRDSDITCQIKYWEAFSPDYDKKGVVSILDLYKLPRLTSIVRERARIQNVYGLFQASDVVKKRRGERADEERDRAIEMQPSIPRLTVYGDESGKTDANLVVASIWMLDGIGALSLLKNIDAAKQRHQFSGEIHFNQIKNRNIDFYRDLIHVIRDGSTALSFKAFVVSRRGIGKVDDALRWMFYHLLVEGVRHEIASGRATLPRTIGFCKDSFEKGYDTILLGQIEEGLSQASGTEFEGKLRVDKCEAVSSRDNPFLQIVDLFAGSINRALNQSLETDNPKDVLAKEFLQIFGATFHEGSFENVGDSTLVLSS